MPFLSFSIISSIWDFSLIKGGATIKQSPVAFKLSPASNNFLKHGEIVKYLKSEYSLTHGYANLIARKYLANN